MSACGVAAPHVAANGHPTGLGQTTGHESLTKDHENATGFGTAAVMVEAVTLNGLVITQFRKTDVFSNRAVFS